ncbi:MAG: hypothetical protein ABFD08_15570 [Syntrophomonas sp.]
MQNLTGIKESFISHPRPPEQQGPSYTGNLLWNGFRSGGYPTAFTPETEATVYQDISAQQCAECENSCTRGSGAQIDHVIPFFKYVDDNADRNGEEVIDGVPWYGYPKEDISALYNDTSNLQILCKSCNAKKGGQSNMGGYKPSTNPEE